MTKNKELFTEVKVSDTELDKVSGGTDITGSESFQINNNSHYPIGTRNSQARFS